jgi:hypothetical protein
LERVVLDLDGIDGRDGVGPSNAAGGAFRDADGFDFAIPDIEYQYGRSKYLSRIGY